MADSNVLIIILVVVLILALVPNAVQWLRGISSNVLWIIVLIIGILLIVGAGSHSDPGTVVVV